MHQLLEFLHGKKTTIVALITTTTAFLALKGVIDLDTSVYVDSMMTILAFGADYKTKQLLGTSRIYKK